jgi:hypothetical protein
MHVGPCTWESTLRYPHLVSTVPVAPPALPGAVFATIRGRVGECSDFRSLDAFFLP